MTAIYPISVRTFIEHDDFFELVDASHVNALQDEVTAIESTLGTNPQVFAPIGAASTSYSTVGGRLDSHERQLATQLGYINTLLAAERQGWSTPALSVTGYSTPNVRWSTTPNTPDPGQSPVAWTGVLVDIGDMYVPGATVVTLPKGGLWLFRGSITGNVDWATLGQVQTYYNHLGVTPVPLAHQRLGLGMYLGDFCADYEYVETAWVPPAQQPVNPAAKLTTQVGFFGTFASGTQLKMVTDQGYGKISGASVSMSAYFQQSVAGVN